MKLMIKLLAVMLVALPITSRSATVLGLAIDRSGSISDADYALQINSYITVLDDVSVLPRDGSVAIGVYSFGESATTIFSVAFITNVNHAALMTAVNGMLVRTGTGATALGDAIQLAANNLLTVGDPADKYIIDVSTDGQGNVGLDQVVASNAALLAGIDQINGLGVGGAANLNFIGGTSSFAVQVSDFSGFDTAIRSKIVREVHGVPEGGPGLVLSGILFAGLAGMRMKMRSSVKAA